jgi:hypothetical protein
MTRARRPLRLVLIPQLPTGLRGLGLVLAAGAVGFAVTSLTLTRPVAGTAIAALTVMAVGAAVWAAHRRDDE